MSLTRIIVGSLVVGWLLCFSSCINEDYTFEKEIDTNVQVGKNFALPIGKTETIRVGDMLAEGDILEVIDGRYVITASDRIVEEVKGVEGMLFENIAPDMGTYERVFKLADNTDLPNIPGLELPEIEVSFEADISTTEDIDVKEEVPSEIKRVSYVKIADGDYNEVKASLILELKGVPDFVPVLHVIGAEFKVPSIIDFEVIEGAKECYKEGSSIFFSQDITITNGTGRITIPVVVKGLKNPDIANGVLTLIDKVELKGSIYADKFKIGVEDLLNVKVTVAPKIELATPHVRIVEVAGAVEPAVDFNTNISLDDLPDFIKEDGFSLGVKDLSLALSIDNPINATIEADMVLSGKNAQGEVINDNRVELSLEVAPGGRTDILINKSSDVIKSGSLLDLLRTIPNSVDFEVTRLLVDCKTPEEFVDLKQSTYSLGIGYDLQLPLEFDEVNISYTEVIEGLQEKLSGVINDVTNFINCLEVHADIDHTIPVNLSLEITPCDASGNVIDGIDYPKSLAIEAAPDNQVRRSALDIRLEETRKGALAELDQLHLVIKAANAINQDVVLRPDQFAVIKILAKLPKGVQVDLKELSEM